MRIIFLGPPGSGKGTQSKIIAHKLSLPHISVGDMVRQMELENPESVSQTKSIMDQGKLIPDDLVLKIINKRISSEDLADGYIFDGFPRNITQAIALEKMLSKLHQSLDVVFYLDAPSQIIIERLVHRRTCPACGSTFHNLYKKPQQKGVCNYCKNKLIHRGDDTENHITYRLSIYNKQTAPLIQYYKEKKLLKEIRAEGTIEEVAAKIMDVFSSPFS